MVLVGTTAAIISVILWTIAGTINKKISSGLGSHISSFIYLLLGILPVILATLIIGVYVIPSFSIITAVIGGVFLGLGLMYGFRALQTENLASVSALAEIQPATLVLFGLLVLGEQITAIQGIGMIVIFAGTVMIITTEKLEINKVLIPAVLATLAWSVYWILMAYSITSAATFALPILISRMVGLPIIVGYMLSDKRSVAKMEGFWGKLKVNRIFMVLIALTIVAAFADASGDTLFGITVGSPVLAIGAALIALQPMIVSFFGFLLYKEKLTKLQLYGLAIMIVGALILSIF